MMSTKRFAGLGLMFLTAALLEGAGCSSSSSGTPAPVDGGTAGAGGSAGSGGSNGTAGTTGTSGAGGGVGGPNGLGATCKATSDCGAGLICLTPDQDIAAGAGVANGICTVECTTNPQTACTPFNGDCVTFETGLQARAFCLEGCMTGVGASAANMKCHLRQDTACAALTMGSACLPVCTDDTECGTRKCNPGSGLCEPQKMVGAPLGASCTGDADCAGGFCLPFNANPDGGPAPGACSEFCRFGNTKAGCSYRLGALDAGPSAGACLYTAASGNIGDLGACGQLCDQPSDCLAKFPQYTCVQDSTIKSIFGHGFCGFNPDGGP